MSVMAARRSRVVPHLFVLDQDLPSDHLGRHRCTKCGLMGKPDDAHHPTNTPPPPARPLKPELAEAARRRDAAVLGEHHDD